MSKKKIYSSIILLVALLIISFGFGINDLKKDLNGFEQVVSAETLAKSKYALDPSRTDYVSSANGLKNPYIVGVDGDKFLNEVKYPTPVGAHVITVSQPSYEFEDSTSAVLNALNEARLYKKEHNDGEVVIKFPAGNFYFYQGSYNYIEDTTFAENQDVFSDGISRYAIYLNGMKNLTFEGSVDQNGKMATQCLLLGQNGFHFMKIENCENVRIYNLQLDYGDIPYYFGEVVEKVDNFTLRIRTWKDYPVEDLAIEVYVEYDKDTNCMREAANNTYNASGSINITNVEYVNNDKHTIDITFKNKVTTTPIGTKVALSNMKTAGTMIKITKSKNIYFETVYIYCGGGSVILGYSNENLYFNRLMAILKPETDRLLSLAGDVIHVEDTKGEIVLTNSQIENTQDDGINLCGHYMYPFNVDSASNSAVLAYRGAVNATYECEVNDVLALMNTVTMKVVGYYQVESVKYENNSYVLQFKKGGKAILPSGEKVNVESDVSKIGSKNDSIFSNITRSPIVTIENCVVRNKRNRGFLIQSRNVTIRNCDFSNVVNTAVMLIGEMASFCESTLPRDVLIENCKFISCDDGDIEIASYNSNGQGGETGAIENVIIRNNLFAYQQNRYSLYLSGVKGLEIENNWFYKTQTGTKAKYDTSAILLNNCSNVTFDKNTLEKFKPSRDGIATLGNIDVESFDFGDNTGFLRKEVFGEIQSIEIAKTTANIVIDGKITDWANIDSTEILINNATNVHIQKVDFNTVPESDFSATVKTVIKMSDGDTWAKDDGIYFYFNVVDDTVHFERSQWWTADCFEFYLSSNTTTYDEIGAIKDDPNTETMQLAMKADIDGNNQPCIYPGRTTTSILEKLTLSTTYSNAEYVSGEIQTAFELTKKGYRGEVFLPFSVFTVCGNQLKSGNDISMVFCFVDTEEKDENELLGTHMTFSNILHPTSTANKIPATMSKFRLCD